MENKDLDRLTRRLMEGTAERPSASLNTRIMALIRQQQAAKIAFVPNMPSIASWLGWFLVYLLLAAGAFYYMYVNKLTMRVILEEMTPYLSLVLTCALADRCILQVYGWIGKEIKKCGNRKKVSNKRLISYQQFTKVINNATIVSE